LAIGHFRTALRQDPASPTVLNAMAIAYDGLGRRDIARDFFARALAADPRSVQTLNNMARSFISMGAADRALPYLKQAAALDPTNPVVLANLQAIDGLTPNDAGEIREASLPLDQERRWIERTSESQQTLVTRVSSAADDAFPPPTSFVKVAAFEAPAGDVSLASWQRPAPVAAAVLPQPPRARRPSVAIANGNGRNGMAARVRGYLENKCWAIGRLQNADRFTYTRTTIGYRAGFLTDAMALAAALPVTAEVVENASMESDIVLRIGRDCLAVESALATIMSKGKS
jgi:tetratricopeptide (TPR) repeat protein